MKEGILMENAFYRDTWAEINIDAIKHNIHTIKETLHKDRELVAVVKADGYGHGAIPVATAALEAGASMLAVATFDEALQLRDAQITAPLFVLGWVDAKYAHIAVEKDIMLTCFQKEWIEEVTTMDLKQPLKVQLKWDTGMGRIGLRTEEELTEIVHALNHASCIQLIGVFTHFATADEVDIHFYQQQLGRFKELQKTFLDIWQHEPVSFHVGNSAASLRFPEEMFDCVRIGISTYGIYPSIIVEEEISTELMPALSLHSRIIQVQQVEPGSGSGYGRSYVAHEGEWIASLPIGYADGWPRKLQGMEVLVEGRRVPIVGRISMDQTTISLKEPVPIGTKVTLIGKQGNDEITAQEVATYLDTIPYEVTCMLGKRIHRVYTYPKS